MSEQNIPTVKGRPPSESDKALINLWSDLEKGQLDILDQANKRIIELVTGLQGLFLAIIALGKDFPPPYLEEGAAPLLAILILILLNLALLSAALGLQPRDYQKYEHNLTEMRQELVRMVHYKKRWYQNGIWLFATGSLALAALISLLILQNSS